MMSIIGALLDPAVERFCTLEEKFKAMEVHFTPSMYVVDMCLVLGLTTLQKFKVPDFNKYKGISYPRTNLRAYYHKMTAYTDNDKLLIHYLQDSLSGASLEWYMQLKRCHIQSWRDLAEAFLKHYQYSDDLAPNCTQLEDMA